MEFLRDHVPPNLLELGGVWSAKLAVSLLIFLGFALAGSIVRGIFRRAGARTNSQREAILNLIGGVARVGLLIFGFVTAAGTLGINVSAMVAGLGLTGFALGFAFRDALSNVLAGIMILLYRPFTRGDRITVTGLEGRVTSVDLRYTTLENESKVFLIPNSILLTNAVTVSKS